MNLEELYQLIEEIEKTNKEYKNIVAKRKEQRLLKKISKKNRIRRNILIYCGVPILLISYLNIKQLTERKLNNIYYNNELKISSKQKEEIISRIEKDLKIKLNEENDEYLLIDAILKNNELSNKEKEILKEALINIIKDNPYLSEELIYDSLLNLDIYYTKRPPYESSTVMGKYIYNLPINYKINKIFIYNKNKKEVLEHEIIHCILINNKNIRFPSFIIEGITELLTNEYYAKNPFKELTCYPFEINAIKILCEIISSETVLESYTTGNINLIYNKLLEIKKDIDPKKFIKSMDNILKSKNPPKKEILDLHNKIKEYFFSSRTRITKEEYDILKYNLKIFDTLKETYPYNSYLEILNNENYIPKYYFNKTLSLKKLSTINKNS